MDWDGSNPQDVQRLTGAFYVGNGWVAGGCWDDYSYSYVIVIVDHSRKFPTLAPVRSQELSSQNFAMAKDAAALALREDPKRCAAVLATP